MPALDRRIAITYRAAGSRDQHGEFVPGEVVWQRTVWARLETQASLTANLTAGGVRIADRVGYRIRYIPEVMQASLTQFQVTDDYGRAVAITAAVEPDDTRRRYLVLTLE